MKIISQLRQHHSDEEAGKIRLSNEFQERGWNDRISDDACFLCSGEVSKEFSILIIVVLTGLVLSILSDTGSFYVWRDPLSDLGALRTIDGELNVVPRTIFDLTMTMSGLIMFRIYSLLSADCRLRFAAVKRAMAFAGGVGFFMLLMPYDVDLGVHEAGASLVFATLWGMTVLFSVELKQTSSAGRALLAQVVLQGTVLPYAILFAADIPSEVVAQKFAVIGLMFSVWYTTGSGHAGIIRSTEYASHRGPAGQGYTHES